MISLIILILSLYFFFSNKKGLSLYLFIALTTGGFWIIGDVTSLFGSTIRLTDFALVYVIVLVLYKLFTGHLEKLKGPFVVLNYLLLFITLAILVDLSLNGTSIGDIFRSSRNWLLLLFVYLLPSFSKEEIQHSFKIVIYTTILELFLFLTEPLTGKVLFSYEGTIKALQLKNVERFALFPPMTLFLFVWYFTSSNIKKIHKNIIIALILIVITITMIRSLILALAFIIILSIFIDNTKSIAKKFVLTLTIITFGIIISSYEPLNKRFTESSSDLSSLSKENSKVEGNMSFRILLASERLEYILSDTQKSIFGIGFITEEHFKKQFIIGLKDNNHRTIQLDTGDIAWAIFFIRLGLFGTFLYLIFYIGVTIFFWKNKNNEIALAGFYYMIIYFIASFTGVNIASGVFVIIPALLYKLTEYTNLEKIKEKL